MTETRFTLAYTGSILKNEPEWLGPDATLKLEADCSDDANNTNTAVILTLNLSTGPAELYRYFPFLTWIYVDEKPAAVIKFSKAGQNETINLQVSCEKAYDLRITSELSGCPEELGIGPDKRDLSVLISGVECVYGVLSPSDAQDPVADIRKWQTENPKRKPLSYLPDAAVRLDETVVKTSSTWLSKPGVFAQTAERVFALEIDLDAMRSAWTYADGSPSDILFQIRALDEVFLAAETVDISLVVNETTLPGMRLVVDRQQTVSAVFLPLALEPGSTLKIEVKALGLDFDRLLNMGCFAFEYYVFAVNRPRLMQDMESRVAWLFSVARSGTTWVGDVCWDMGDIAVIDEPALPRMLGISQTDPELFHVTNNAIWRDNPLSPGVCLDEISQTVKINQDCDLHPVIPRQILRYAEVRNAIWASHSRNLLQQFFIDAQLEQIIREYGIGWYKSVLMKCPNDAQIADFISLWMPRSRLIMLVRDGRDIIRSRFSAFASETLNQSKNRDTRLYCIAYYAQMWNAQLDISEAAYFQHDNSKKLSLVYEEMRTDGFNFVKSLSTFMGKSLDDEAIERISEARKLENAPPASRGDNKPRQHGKIGGYKKYFNDEEIALMNTIMQRNLEKHGYFHEETEAESQETSSAPYSVAT